MAGKEEIVALRDEKGLTFKAIGERCHISATGAMQIYRSAQRELRRQQHKESCGAEQRKMVSLDLTLGEAAFLIRVLGDFKRRKMRAGGKRREQKGYLEDAEYLAAAELGARLYRLEQGEG